MSYKTIGLQRTEARKGVAHGQGYSTGQSALTLQVREWIIRRHQAGITQKQIAAESAGRVSVTTVGYVIGKWKQKHEKGTGAP